MSSLRSDFYSSKNEVNSCQTPSPPPQKKGCVRIKPNHSCTYWRRKAANYLISQLVSMMNTKNFSKSRDTAKNQSRMSAQTHLDSQNFQLIPQERPKNIKNQERQTELRGNWCPCTIFSSGGNREPLRTGEKQFCDTTQGLAGVDRPIHENDFRRLIIDAFLQCQSDRWG